MSSKLKRNISLIKEESEKRLIAQQLFESRILAITDGKNIEEVLSNLTESQRLDFSIRLLEEIVKYQDNKYVNEQFFDFFKKFAGVGLDSAIETAVESVMMGIFSWMGIEKWWLSRQITSIIATDPRRLLKAFKAESTVEAMVMGYQQQSKSVKGPFADFFRNAIGNWAQDSALVKQVEDLISNQVCSLFGKAKKDLSPATSGS
jgi:hypothetical protein